MEGGREEGGREEGRMKGMCDGREEGGWREGGREGLGTNETIFDKVNDGRIEFFVLLN